MSSKAATEKKPERGPLGDGWQATRERAPSVVREEEPRTARLIGFCGMLLVALGAMGLVMYAADRITRVGPGLSSLFTVLGLAGLLFHAARDRDLQVRRLYGGFGLLCLIAGLILSAIPSGSGGTPPFFLPYGYGSATLGLLFLLVFGHNETEAPWRERTLWLLGGVGVLAAVAGFGGNFVRPEFLLPYGCLLALLGLGYLWAFVGLQGTGSDLGYRVGLAVGGLGLLVFLTALVRSVVPALVPSMKFAPYAVPNGLLLMGLGLLYVAMSAALCSDNRLIVMTRRELAGFFYSPIAYIVLFGLTLVAWGLFYIFVGTIVETSLPGRSPLVEPVIRYYIIDWFPIICVMVVVPILTMKLMSEEQRTGTLEVLLTAPVDETAVVVSKYLGAWLFFMALWVPWGLFLIALRVFGGEAFDYRPLLSFFFALSATGAGFIAMGLFFSSLTRNQIAAAILSFVGMLALTMLFFAKRSMTPDSVGNVVLTYVSYIDLWINSLEGTLSPRYLMFHLSAAVFWLFLTVKVLESRKWK